MGTVTVVLVSTVHASMSTYVGIYVSMYVVFGVVSKCIIEVGRRA